MQRKQQLKEQLTSIGLDLDGMELASDKASFGISITCDASVGRVTAVLHGPQEAITRLYSQCAQHPKVVLYSIV